MNDDIYCYPPDYKVLRNKLGLRDERTLELVERQLVSNRAMETLPNGDFDLRHLCTIHFQLFQDVYN